MLIELKADEHTIVKVDLDVERLSKLFMSSNGSTQTRALPKSTPMTKTQAEELLTKIDPKSAHFLRQLAANHGTITWDDMRAIFGIDDQTDWNSYALSYGKGITRAFRHLLQNKSARLVWWIDEDWEKEPWGSDTLTESTRERMSKII